MSGDGRKDRSLATLARGWQQYRDGDQTGDRLRTDFAGSTTRSNPKRSNPKRSVPHRIELEHGGTAPTSPAPPRPPPVRVIYQDLAEQLGLDLGRPDGPGERGVAVYGQYPRGLIAAMLPWLRCERREVVHVCSGALPPGEGIRVDIRPEAKPDVIADGRALPFADGTIAAVMLDPPYTKHYARELYGVDYPRPAHLLREAARVVRPGGRVVFVHYITPRPPPALRFVRALGLSTGFDMPIRAVSVYERPPQEDLDLEWPP